MDANYKPLHRQADQLHNKFLNMRDDRSHELSQWLEVQTREIREDIERGKPPRSVENRIKDVLKRLEGAKSQETTAIDVRDADTLVNAYEDLQRDLRKLPNY